LPLSEKARIEVYLPDLAQPAYQDLLVSLEQELTFAFGGCTTVRGLDGNYLSRAGTVLPDRINLVYTDAPFSFQQHADRIDRYAQALRDATFDALNEEVVLVAVHPVFHSE
jgi:hypothetical protein